MRSEIAWEKEKVYIKSAPEEAFAVRRTATKHRPEALAGIHANTVLAVFEEASGLPDETVETGAGTLSTPGAMAVAVGNPTRGRGFFYKTHKDPKVCLTWDTMVVSSEEVPRARGHIADIINLYGKDSNKYRVRVLGEFPTKDDDVVIPLESILAAKGRKVTLSHVYPVWGVDVARFGDDRTTLCKRQGNALIDAPKIWRNLDGKQVADRIVKEYQRTVVDLRPKAICVDAIGIGVSVVDHLRYNPTLVADDVQIISVNVAESAARDPENHRLRDELWWAGREWFAGLDVVIPDTADPNMSTEDKEAIEGLIQELAIPTYDFTRAEKRIVMTKDDMKRELGYSPDIADGFINTFAAPVFPRPSDVHRRRPWERDRASDPWAA
jgi:phage terminase large subunit